MNQMTTFQNEQELLQEDWQAKAERLEALVSILLAKNESLRAAVLVERSNCQEHLSSTATTKNNAR